MVLRLSRFVGCRLRQVLGQDFGGEGASSGSQHQKGVRGVTAGKILKNVNAIWCIILYLLHKNHEFSFFFSFFFFSFSLFFIYFYGGVGPTPPGCATGLCIPHKYTRITQLSGNSYENIAVGLFAIKKHVDKSSIV